MDIFLLQKNASVSARKCQRNWDYSREIPKEHLDHFVDIAKNAPSKQDEDYYNIVVITDREKIELVYNSSVGFTMVDENNNVIPDELTGDPAWKNPQSRANVLLLYMAKKPSTNHTFYWGKDKESYHLNGQPIPNTDEGKLIEDTYTAIGCSIGLTAFAAAQLGYVTGPNKNLGDRQKLKTLLELDDMDGWPIYTLGIGFPDVNLPHYISHENKNYGSISTGRNRPVQIKYLS
jgi:nitroreductase